MSQTQHTMSAPLTATPAAAPGAGGQDERASASVDHEGGGAQRQSALSITRAAIARWRGAALAPGALPRDRTRVSPQARWLAAASAGLDHWIAGGGFAQGEQVCPAVAPLPPLAGPVMYRLPVGAPANTDAASGRACRLN